MLAFDFSNERDTRSGSVSESCNPNVEFHMSIIPLATGIWGESKPAQMIVSNFCKHNVSCGLYERRTFRTADSKARHYLQVRMY